MVSMSETASVKKDGHNRQKAYLIHAELES